MARHREGEMWLSRRCSLLPPLELHAAPGSSGHAPLTSHQEKSWQRQGKASWGKRMWVVGYATHGLILAPSHTHMNIYIHRFTYDCTDLHNILCTHLEIHHTHTQTHTQTPLNICVEIEGSSFSIASDTDLDWLCLEATDIHTAGNPFHCELEFQWTLKNKGTAEAMLSVHHKRSNKIDQTDPNKKALPKNRNRLRAFLWLLVWTAHEFDMHCNMPYTAFFIPNERLSK